MESAPRSTRSALIVAIDTYRDPKLSQLRAPGQDAEALASVLGDPAIGGFDVSVCHNESYASISPTLERFFNDRRRDDVLLVHFSCHGIKDAGGRLYFAASDTNRDLLQTTAVPAELVNELMTDCRSRNIVLLLDCCYSGAFTRELSRSDGAMDVVERFPGSGRAVLTASSALEYAFEGSEVTGEGTPSYFTNAVVRGLRTGGAARTGDEWISIDELYEYVYDAVRRQTPNQTPVKSSTVQGRLLIAKNPNSPLAGSTEIPADLLVEANSESAEARIVAVGKLALLARSRRQELAQKARSLLAQLAADDSRRVSSGAVAALAETDVGPGGPDAPAAVARAAEPASPPSPLLRPPVPDDPPPALSDTPPPADVAPPRGRTPDAEPRPRREAGVGRGSTARPMARQRTVSMFGLPIGFNRLTIVGLAALLIGIPAGVAYCNRPASAPSGASTDAAGQNATPGAPSIGTAKPGAATLTSPQTPLPAPERLVATLDAQLPWEDSVYGAAFSPDGQRVAFASRRGRLLIWDPSRGKSDSNPQVPPVQHGEASEVTSVDFGPSTSAPRILTTSGDGRAVAWTPSGNSWSGQIIDLRDGGPALWAGALSHDGARVATAGNDSIVKVMSPTGGQPIRLEVGSPVWSVAFSRDGAYILTGAQGGSAPLKLWPSQGGQPIWAPSSMQDQWVREAAIDPSGKLIAAASDDGQVRLWRSQADPPTPLSGHSNQTAYSVAFSDDGSLIATAGDDGFVRVFDSATAANVATIEPVGSDKRVYSVRFSRQGRRLVTTGNSGAVRVYTLAPASPPTATRAPAAVPAPQTVRTPAPTPRPSQSPAASPQAKR